MHWTDKLSEIGACSGAINWARTQPDLNTAWNLCGRGDWMLWLVGRLSGEVGSPARLRVVAAAADCAELALPLWEARYPDDKRPRNAIETTRRYARGEATLIEVRASAAAAAAAYAASDASYTAASAADAAADAAAASYTAASASSAAADAAADAAAASYTAASASSAASYAASAAASAASAAASAASASYAAYAAAAAERARILRECADICRRHFPDPPSL